MSITLDIMVNIILYGDIKDKSITSKLCRALSDYDGVLYLSDAKVNRYGNLSEISFLIYECDNLNEITAPNSIILFKSKQTNDFKIKLSASTISIMESTNQKAIAAIHGNDSPCVSCGMSGNDSITLSSINDTDATISIQRSVSDIYGHIIEPCDIKVKLKHFCDGFTLLSIIGVLIISGQLNDNSFNI